MPCYNAEAHLREAVDSVLNQTYPQVELIVIDDGSTDHSLDILQSYGDRIKVLSQINQGPYPARNHGLAHATGEYVAFLDADDWWSLDCLEKLHAALVARPECALAYCGWQNVGEGIHSAPYVPPEYEKEDIVAHFIRTCPWPIHAALVKKSVVEQLGGFSERCFSSMDYDFWLRTLALTRCIVRVSEVLAYYRWHSAGQISATKSRQVLQALQVQRDFIQANPKLVAHILPERLWEVTEGQVLKQAYRAFWKRDLVSAQKLFRHAALAGAWRWSDVPHIVPAMLPMWVYQTLVSFSDRRQGQA
jgi:glycosyltransferase involved in cell wall biosynthesis